MQLENKVAIVTGSDSGIGHAIALELASQGAAVTINYHKNADAADATKAAIEAAGGRATVVQADVSSVADLQRLVDATVTAFGRLDIMVNNAGHGDADVGARDDGAPVRPRHRGGPQERVLRGPDRGEADDRPGRQGPDHQHLVDPRGLADAGQRAVLPRQGRRSDADPDGRRRVGAARHHGRRCRPGRGPHPDRRGHASPTRYSGRSSSRRSRSAGWPNPRRSRALVAFLASDKASYGTATTYVADGGMMQASVGL